IELLVTVAVVAILLAIAFPNFEGSMRRNRLATTTNELLGSVALARSEAILNTRGAGICASADGLACGGDWDVGWRVWTDGAHPRPQPVAGVVGRAGLRDRAFAYRRRPPPVARAVVTPQPHA